MVVSIIGWYGTETQGDIAILDGILSIISKLDNSITVNLGSLYKFYTERTLLLNKDIFNINSSNVNISIFDIKDARERFHYVKNSDLLLIGGGPLDNIREILLLEKCFEIAKQENIPSMIFGCGIDVLTDSKCINSLRNISKISDLILVRDENTKDKFEKLFKDIEEKIYTIQDPAILSVNNFKNGNENQIKRNKSISINLRKYTQGEYISPIYYSDNDFIDFINYVAAQYETVNLVPMHTFFVGEDDRYYLSKLKLLSNVNNINVIHKPQSLYELYDMFQESLACVGMRYHSVVMQTILNGNNLIFDYTNPQNGKITGFLQDNSLVYDYENRICHLQDSKKINLCKLSNQLENAIHPKNIPYNEEYIINLIKTII